MHTWSQWENPQRDWPGKTEGLSDEPMNQKLFWRKTYMEEKENGAESRCVPCNSPCPQTDALPETISKVFRKWLRRRKSTVCPVLPPSPSPDPWLRREAVALDTCSYAWGWTNPQPRPMGRCGCAAPEVPLICARSTSCLKTCTALCRQLSLAAGYANSLS